MSRITAQDAFRMLAQWSQERAAIHVVLSRSAHPQAANSAIVNQVLAHSQKVLLTLRDENGEDVDVTVNLEGAEWDTGAGCTCSPRQETGADYTGSPRQDNDAAAVPPNLADIEQVGFLAATFPNGSRYVFGAKAEPQK